MVRRAQSRNSLKNMKQYKDMSDEEFNKLYSQIIFGQERDDVVQERFNRLMKQFEEEYDLTELLPNDRVILRNLINSMIQLEDFEVQIRSLSLDVQSVANNIVVIDRLSGVCDKLRSSISNMQGDLGITRKIRKSDKEHSVITFLEDLKKRASQFVAQKMDFIFCEKCGELLATIWWLNHDSPKSRVTLYCTKKREDGEPCGWSKTFTAKELLEKGGSNQADRLPETLR